MRNKKPQGPAPAGAAPDEAAQKGGAELNDEQLGEVAGGTETKSEYFEFKLENVFVSST